MTPSPKLRRRARQHRDGVRVDWPDGWVSVRASNTEPILRIISESPDETSAMARIADARQAAGL